MSSLYGDHLKLSIFGQSHGAAIGMTLDGIPAGLKVNFDELQAFLNRRAPGHSAYATPRKEQDAPEFLSGLVDGITCGAPISAIIRNTNTQSGDYENLKDCPRPGHADYAAQVKYGGFQDVAGGGHFSGRLTAPLCIAGGMCMQWLNVQGIHIGAHIASVGTQKDRLFCPVAPELESVCKDFPVLDCSCGERMQQAILHAKTQLDSIGGTIECAITGVPAGLGDPMFDGVENRLARILFGIPAVKGVEFGSGFAGSQVKGSENNDSFTIEGDEVKTETNNCGGILGGITNGMPILFRVALKPTPSIGKFQQSVSLSQNKTVPLQVQGRHDPCIVPRAVPVVEAAAAIAIMDMMI